MTPITDDEMAARGAAIVRSVRVEPPFALRERVEAQRARSVVARGRRLRLRQGAAAAGVAAAAAAAVVLALGSGRDPSLGDAAEIGALPASSGPPAAANAKLLAASHAGIQFPNWTGRFGWRASGQRADEIDGRSARTVVYAKGGNQVAYTIVDGDVLAGTGGPDRIEDGRRVVAFERGGHTCLVSAPTSVKRNVLLKLAAWQPA